MTDLGPLSYFLGLEVGPSNQRYISSQIKYPLDILDIPHLSDRKTTETPLLLNFKVSPSDSELLPNPTFYWHLFGMMKYLAINCPDIAYVVHTVSRFNSAPSTTNSSDVLLIIRYISGMLNQGLFLSFTSTPCLTVYSNVNWYSDFTDHTSTTRYLVYFGDKIISWGSKKQ